MVFRSTGIPRTTLVNLSDPESKAKRPQTPPSDKHLNARLIEDSQECINVLDLEGRLVSMNAGGMKVLEICDLDPVLGSS